MIQGDASAALGRQGGFSLMEAIVAVAILGVASVPLLMLQSQNARSVIRLEASATRIGAEKVVADYLSVVDVATASSGDIDIGGGWTVTWQATPVSDGVSTVIGVGDEGRYASQLIRIAAVSQHSNGQEFEVEVYRAAVQETSAYR